ncbi:MAG: hypothetical protein ACPGU7_11610 [Gammaproteobacteria bacterium]
MRTFHHLPPAISGAVFLLTLTLTGGGAFAAEHAGAAPTESDQGATLGELKQETADVLETLKEYSADRRDEAVATAGDALAKLDRRINALERKIDTNWDDMSASTRAQSRETLRALRAQRVKLAEWYGGLKAGSASAWGKLKQGFGKAYEDIQSAWSESKEAFREAR